MEVRNATGHSLDFDAGWQSGPIVEPTLLGTTDDLVIGCHNEQMRLTRDEVVELIDRMQQVMLDNRMHA